MHDAALQYGTTGLKFIQEMPRVRGKVQEFLSC